MGLQAAIKKLKETIEVAEKVFGWLTDFGRFSQLHHRVIHGRPNLDYLLLLLDRNEGMAGVVDSGLVNPGDPKQEWKEPFIKEIGREATDRLAKWFEDAASHSDDWSSDVMEDFREWADFHLLYQDDHDEWCRLIEAYLHSPVDVRAAFRHYQLGLLNS